VEAVLGILRRELMTVMRQMGTLTRRTITSAAVVDRGRW
jgi:hypothetical protein